MRALKFLLLMFAVVALLSMGAYGCAKKQTVAKGGEVEAAKPAQAEESKDTGKRETTEAPPGPKEQPEPAESAKAEKSLEDIHFDFDRFEIRSGDAKILQDNAGWLKANPNAIATIEGHCDDRGTVEYNLSLGEKRADAARDYLVSLGIDAKRIKTISYGKSKPMDTGQNEEAWAKNRRAHFVVQ